MGYGDLRKGRVSLAGQEYLVTTVCAGRRAAFADPANSHVMMDELRRLDQERYLEWLAWVLMPDHFHGLLRLGERGGLSEVMRLLKGRSSRAAGSLVWQPGFHDHALRSGEDRRNAARYLLANPLRAGLVDSLNEYPLWYCAWLEPGDDPDLFLER